MVATADLVSYAIAVSGLTTALTRWLVALVLGRTEFLILIAREALKVSFILFEYHYFTSITHSHPVDNEACNQGSATGTMSKAQLSIYISK